MNSTASIHQQDMFGFSPERKFGTEPKKLVRRVAPKTSVDAACKVDTATKEKMVFDAIKSFGKNGCISDDILAIFSHLPYSTVTARYKSLEEKNLIKYCGDTREGRSGRDQRVMRAII